MTLRKGHLVVVNYPALDYHLSLATVTGRVQDRQWVRDWQLWAIDLGGGLEVALPAGNLIPIPRARRRRR